MKLIDALDNIQYDSSWGIWAELIDGEFKLESEARYGQHCFENGGLLDDKKYVCDGENIGDHKTNWIDDDGNLIDGWCEEFIYEINQPRE